jgi:hypothetical protein
MVVSFHLRLDFPSDSFILPYKNPVPIFISSLDDRERMKSLNIRSVRIRNSRMHHDSMYFGACLLGHKLQLMVPLAYFVGCVYSKINCFFSLVRPA